MDEIAERKPAMTLLSGRVGPTGPDTLTWTVEQVMKWYGFSYDDVNSWGGRVLFPGPAVVGVPMVRRGEGNAIFQEGVHDESWEELADARPMRCLELAEGAVAHMEDTFGYDRAIIPKGRLKGIERDLLTLSFRRLAVVLPCRSSGGDRLSAGADKYGAQGPDPPPLTRTCRLI